ncbi:sugar ABC transporter substrate-binding protein, partial [Streptosporangium sp. NPDC001682]
DATVQGLQNILAGDQCMTVYKAIKKEALGPLARGPKVSVFSAAFSAAPVTTWARSGSTD